MSNDTNNGGPAFPGQWYDFQPLTGEQVVREQWEGMSLRQYAAIHLRVPDSGVDWMDEMIRKAQRDYFAAKALPEVLAQKDVHGHLREWENAAWISYQIADAMLRKRETIND